MLTQKNYSIYKFVNKSNGLRWDKKKKKYQRFLQFYSFWYVDFVGYIFFQLSSLQSFAFVFDMHVDSTFCCLKHLCACL